MALPLTPPGEACWRLLSQTEDEQPRAVFALLDGARVRLLPGLLEETPDVEYECLFPGETDPVELTRAPYLVRVKEDSEICRWLLDEGWGKSWGIYVLCRQGTELDPVLRDLRELLQARLPDGRVVRFRFFDPRVWRPFFPTCDARQVRRLFGRAVEAFACEDADGRAVLMESARNGLPQRRKHPLPHD
ncbi:MAG TPA: DUF4123 domain-containing protein [Chthoniobacteraceae bacterium]|jgi:hypothetical protein|nr:DUF4123 domain-containing protein [Chthoniobacteraceae bacterium]